MTVETATKVEDLNENYPAAGDLISESDNHARLIKACLKYTFAGAASTGVTGFNVVTQPPGTNTTVAASTAFVSAGIAAAAFSTVLPSQSGNAGKVIRTDGTNATWGDVLAITNVSGTTQTAVSGSEYLLSNVAATAVTAPTAVDGVRFAVTPVNGLTTNTVDFGAATVRGPSGTTTGVITLDLGQRLEVIYSSTLSKWVIL